jgi:hypothetical protein
MKKNKKKSRFKGAVSRNAERQARGVSQYGYLRLPKGVNIFKEEPRTRVELDVIPYVVTGDNHPDKDEEYGIAVKGELWYKRPYWLHRGVGPDNQSVVCPSSVGKPCPICEYRAQLLKDGARWDDDTVKALKPSMRNLYVVIPKNNKNYSEEPHIWDISQFLFQDKLNEEIQENEEYETFPDLEEGYTVRIRFAEGTFGSNKFAEVSRIDFIERKKPYDESILEKIPSLDDMLEVLPYPTIEAMFFGNMSPDEDEEEEYDDEEKKKKRKVDEDEDIDDDMEEEEDEEDDDEEVDEDEDDEEDDEDDEDIDDEEDEDEEEEEHDKKKSKKSPPKRQQPHSKVTKGKGKNKCPYGHEFGVDNDSYDDCDSCEVWEKCLEASENE